MPAPSPVPYALLWTLLRRTSQTILQPFVPSWRVPHLILPWRLPSLQWTGAIDPASTATEI